MCLGSSGSSEPVDEAATQARAQRAEQEQALGRKLNDQDYELVEVDPTDKKPGEKLEKGVKGWTYRKQLKVPVLEAITLGTRRNSALNIPVDYVGGDGGSSGPSGGASL